MTKNKRDSAALHLIRHVWEHNREATGFSWTRLNGSMHGAVMLAIEAGLKFNLGDFTYIAENFRVGYWGGNDGHMCGEAFYSHAVKFDHLSACQSFEAWKNRKPFNWDGQRVCIGQQFIWQRERVSVTSFAADGLSFIATAYKEAKTDKRGYVIGPTKVQSRYKITNADLSIARKALKPKPAQEIAQEKTV